jgi:hypothetical protein
VILLRKKRTPNGVARDHGTGLAMIEGHHGKWIPEKGLDPAVLQALDRAEDRDLDRDPLGPIKVASANSVTYECEEGDLNPHGCYPTSPSN